MLPGEDVPEDVVGFLRLWLRFCEACPKFEVLPLTDFQVLRSNFGPTSASKSKEGAI